MLEIVSIKDAMHCDFILFDFSFLFFSFIVCVGLELTDNGNGECMPVLCCAVVYKMEIVLRFPTNFIAFHLIFLINIFCLRFPFPPLHHLPCVYFSICIACILF